MSFADKLKKFTNDAVEKGKGIAEQGKLALDNQKQQDAIKRAQQLIGAYVAENNLLAEDEFIMNQLSAIAAANENIERNNSRIADLKASGAEEPAYEAPEAYPDAPAEQAEPSAEPCECEKEPVQRAFCPACGKEVDPGARFCPGCGKQLQ